MKQRSINSEKQNEIRYESRSLAKGLQLIEVLAASPTPLGLKDLASAAGLGKASTLRLLHTLQSLGYLGRDDSDAYVIDRDWPSAERHEALRRLTAAARPQLARLSAQFGETVAVAFLFDDVIRVVDVAESLHPIRMSNYKGRVLQPYASSMGKAITAFQAPLKIQALLHTYGVFPLTPQTLTDFRAILQDLEGVRERGFAWDRGETVPGGCCVGVPVHGGAGQVFAGMSISMPKERFTPELEKVLPPVMMEAAQAVSQAMAAR
jgi:IclR family acetate operon transcriptional repressor